MAKITAAEKAEAARIEAEAEAARIEAEAVRNGWMSKIAARIDAWALSKEGKIADIIASLSPGVPKAEAVAFLSGIGFVKDGFHELVKPADVDNVTAALVLGEVEWQALNDKAAAIAKERLVATSAAVLARRLGIEMLKGKSLDDAASAIDRKAITDHELAKADWLAGFKRLMKGADLFVLSNEQINALGIIEAVDVDTLAIDAEAVAKLAAEAEENAEAA